MRVNNKILLSFLVFFAILAIGISVSASNDGAVDIFNGLFNTNNNTSETNNTTSSTTNNTVNTDNTTNTVNQVSTINKTNTTNSTSVNNIISQTTNNTVNNTENLPKTGIDTTIVFVIVAFGISAIYAYKKISDYNM